MTRIRGSWHYNPPWRTLDVRHGGRVAGRGPARGRGTRVRVGERAAAGEALPAAYPAQALPAACNNGQTEHNLTIFRGLRSDPRSYVIMEEEQRRHKACELDKLKQCRFCNYHLEQGFDCADQTTKKHTGSKQAP